MMQLAHVGNGAGNDAGNLIIQEGDLREFGSRLAGLLNDYNSLIAPGALPERFPVKLDDVLRLRRLGQRADWLYKARRKRSKYFGCDIFGEPGWDILLDLFSADCTGKTVSITSACIGSGVPSTTALRWIAALSDAGLLERCDDPSDRRRAFVRLSDQGRSAMAGFLEDTMKN